MSESKAVKLAPLYDRFLLGAITKEGLQVDFSSPLQTLAKELQHHMKKKYGEMGVCDFCGFESDEEQYSVCPYCGDDHIRKEESAMKAHVKEEKAKAKAEEKARVKEEKAKAKADEKAKAKEAKAKEPKAPKEVKAKEPKAAAMVKIKHNAPETSVSLEAIQAKYSEGDLDESISRIKSLESATRVSLWQYAKEIHRVYEQQLWRLRTRDGKSVYATDSSFANFTRVELGISPQYAYTLMDVSKNFSEEEVAQLGVAKLSLMLKAPEQAKPELMQKAKEGATVSELREDVTTARKELGAPSRDTGRKEIAANKSVETRATKKVEKITISEIEGRRRVPLYTMATIDSKKPSAAKSLRDKPIGSMELQNDVFMTFEVIANVKGELILNILTKREDPEDLLDTSEQEAEGEEPEDDDDSDDDDDDSDDDQE